MEALCLVSFAQRNVRELIHVAEAYAARVAMRGEEGRRALGAVLAERYPDNPVVSRERGEAKGSGGKPASGWSQAPGGDRRGLPRVRDEPLGH